LPVFLKSLSEEDLEKLISDIEENITLKQEAQYKFYTIHSYKGLEDDNIRISIDIEDMVGDKDKNLYYVALTRGMKNIVEDID
jgi:superfamily I DNA/RNA helicase